MRQQLSRSDTTARAKPRRAAECPSPRLCACEPPAVNQSDRRSASPAAPEHDNHRSAVASEASDLPGGMPWRCAARHIRHPRIRARHQESWFVARAHHDLAGRGVRGVVAFADPLPRHTADGRVITPGHAGVVYQALNFQLAGATSPRRLTVLPDGTTFSDRAAQKVRSGDRGHDYAERRSSRSAPPPSRTARTRDAGSPTPSPPSEPDASHIPATTGTARRSAPDEPDSSSPTPHAARPATSLRLW